LIARHFPRWLRFGSKSLNIGFVGLAAAFSIGAMFDLERVWSSSQATLLSALAYQPGHEQVGDGPRGMRVVGGPPDSIAARPIAQPEFYARRLSDLRARVLWALAGFMLSMLAGAAGVLGLFQRRRDVERRLAVVSGRLDVAVLQRRTTATLLESLVNLSPDFIWSQDREGRLTFANPAYLQLIGATAEEAIGRRTAEFDRFADHGRAAALARVYSEGAPQTVDTHGTTADGTLVHYRITNTPLHNDKGEITGVICQSSNITRSHTDSALLEVIGAGSPEYIYAKDLEGRFTYANAATLRLARKPIEEVLGRTCEIFNFLPEETAAYEASDRTVMLEGRIVKTDPIVVTQEGVSRVLEASKFPLRASNGEIIGLAAVSTDITEAHQARQALADSERMVRTLSNFMPNIIWSMTSDGVVEYVNDRWYEFTGLSRDELEPDWPDLVHPDDRGRAKAAAAASLESGAPFDIRYRMRRRDGLYRWGVARAIPVVSEHDGVTRWMGSFTDIQDLMEARESTELALGKARVREEQLASILDCIPDAMVVSDAKGTVRSFSAAAERQYGWTAEEMIGRKVTRLLEPSQRAGYRANLAIALKEPTKVIGQRKDGSTFPVELVIGRAGVGKDRLFISFARDLSERQASDRHMQDLQVDLAHVSRLSAMGEMAAAMAHELNQPLAAGSNFVNASIQMLRNEPRDMGKLVHTMERASAQMLRAGDIIRRLRDFVSKATPDHEGHDLVAMIEEARALAMTNFKARGVTVKLRVESGAPEVLVDRIQIQQVLFNLLRNAIEAMADSEQRVLTIGAKRTTGGMVRISVSDTGPGVDEALAGELFKPFLTTKADGMGIGLSVSRSIVESHGGRIWIEKAPGGGAVFRFTVPVAEDGVSDRAAA
jgi:two-component system sensor kinase FixL